MAKEIKNGYWQILDTDYFINAIKIFNEQYDNLKLFFFSDELNWVEENIIPEISDFDYKLVDLNDSANGYKDLVLLSKCRHLIASGGSLAKFSYVLNRDIKRTMLMPYKSLLPFNKYLPNITLLNENGKEYRKRHK